MAKPIPSPILRDYRYVYQVDDKKADTQAQKRIRDEKNSNFSKFMLMLSKLEKEHREEAREWAKDERERPAGAVSEDVEDAGDLRAREMIAKLLDEIKAKRVKVSL